MTMSKLHNDVSQWGWSELLALLLADQDEDWSNQPPVSVMYKGFKEGYHVFAALWESENGGEDMYEVNKFWIGLNHRGLTCAYSQAADPICGIDRGLALLKQTKL